MARNGGKTPLRRTKVVKNFKTVAYSGRRFYFGIPRLDLAIPSGYQGKTKMMDTGNAKKEPE
ncbi:hypothetical protein RUM43_013748 [Polyplax serrata]|uniref:Uncharacterized protein n=1 Tax=Polyplax serrata TaxID=468196 RepID=A0AAN8NX96_POLSC